MCGEDVLGVVVGGKALRRQAGMNSVLGVTVVLPVHTQLMFSQCMSSGGRKFCTTSCAYLTGEEMVELSCSQWHRQALQHKLPHTLHRLVNHVSTGITEEVIKHNWIYWLTESQRLGTVFVTDVTLFFHMLSPLCNFYCDVLVLFCSSHCTLALLTELSRVYHNHHFVHPLSGI